MRHAAWRSKYVPLGMDEPSGQLIISCELAGAWTAVYAGRLGEAGAMGMAGVWDPARLRVCSCPCRDADECMHHVLIFFPRVWSMSIPCQPMST